MSLESSIPTLTTDNSDVNTHVADDDVRGVDEKFFICDGEGPAEDYGPPGCFFGFDPDAICGHLWAIPEPCIIYSFCDGDAIQRDKVVKTMKIWEKYVNLRFEPDLKKKGTYIRISFNSQPGRNWCRVGSQTFMPVWRKEPTMNLGLVTNTPEFTLGEQRTILHALGHVVGLYHEHPKSEATLKWNEEQCIEHYGPYTKRVKQEHWLKENIYIHGENSNFGKLDLDSIMTYAIPQNCYEANTPENLQMKPNSHDLSPQDIALLRIFYPKPEDMGTSPFQDALRLSRIPVEVSKDWSPENVRRKYCTYMSELNRGPNLYTYPEPIRGETSLAFHLVTMTNMWELEPDSYIRKEYSELLEFYNLLVEKGWNVSDLPSAEELSENWRALSGWTRNFGKDIGSKGDEYRKEICRFLKSDAQAEDLRWGVPEADSDAEA